MVDADTTEGVGSRIRALARDDRDDGGPARRLKAALLGGRFERVLGRYRVRGELGAGGMGTVLRAFDPELARDVAVKVLRLGDGVDVGQLRARLRREAKAAAALSHPNVVEIYDVGVDGSDIFVSMELIDGTDARAWIGGGKKHWRAALDVFIPAGRGLEAIHRVGLVHRDFKPANVMLTFSPGAQRPTRVTVVDFGLARGQGAIAEASDAASVGQDSVDTITGTQQVIGTRGYMPPEQLCGEAVDARSDQYAFCVSVYQALHGRRPHVGVDVATLCAAKRRGLQGEVVGPRWLHRVLARGLQPDPERRYPSMTELLAELEHGRRRRRGPLAAVLLGALSVGAIAVTEPTASPPSVTDPRCDDPAPRVWAETERTGVHRRFRAAGGAELSAWVDANEVLLSYDRALVQAHAAICEGSAADHNDALGCLAAARASAGETVAGIVEAEPGDGGALVVRARQLPALVPCLPAGHRDANSASYPPGDTEAATEMLALADRYWKHTEAGEHDPALALAQQIAARGDRDAIPHFSVHGRALARFVMLRRRERLPAHALATEAFWIADGGASADVAANAAIALIESTASLERFEEAERWVGHARALQRRQDLSPFAAAQIQDALGQLRLRQGRGEEALDHLQRYAASWSTAAPDSAGRLRAECNAAVVVASLERFEAARGLLQRCLRADVRREGPDSLRVASWHNNLRGVEQGLSALGAALGHAERVVEIHARVLGGQHVDTLVAQQFRALILIDLGRLGEAREVLGIIAEAEVPDNFRRHLVVARARLLVAEGRLEAAETMLRRELSDVDRDGPFTPTALIELGRLTRRRGDLVASARLFDEAADHPSLEGWTAGELAVERATTAVAQGDLDHAQQLVAPALDSARVAVRVEAQLVRGSIARARGDTRAQCKYGSEAAAALPDGAPQRLRLRARRELADCP
ncbi:MAG: serine/threonine-protein kinase [Myxococcota bacterium]